MPRKIGKTGTIGRKITGGNKATTDEIENALKIINSQEVDGATMGCSGCDDSCADCNVGCNDDKCSGCVHCNVTCNCEESDEISEVAYTSEVLEKHIEQIRKQYVNTEIDPVDDCETVIQPEEQKSK